MKTECAAFVLLFTILLINCCLPVYSQADYQAPIDTSGEKVESREVKCLGEYFVPSKNCSPKVVSSCIRLSDWAYWKRPRFTTSTTESDTRISTSGFMIRCLSTNWVRVCRMRPTTSILIIIIIALSISNSGQKFEIFKIFRTSRFDGLAVGRSYSTVIYFEKKTLFCSM